MTISTRYAANRVSACIHTFDKDQIALTYGEQCNVTGMSQAVELPEESERNEGNHDQGNPVLSRKHPCRRVYVRRCKVVVKRENNIRHERLYDDEIALDAYQDRTDFSDSLKYLPYRNTETLDCNSGVEKDGSFGECHFRNGEERCSPMGCLGST